MLSSLQNFPPTDLRTAFAAKVRVSAGSGEGFRRSLDQADLPDRARHNDAASRKDRPDRAKGGADRKADDDRESAAIGGAGQPDRSHRATSSDDDPSAQSAGDAQGAVAVAGAEGAGEEAEPKFAERADRADGQGASLHATRPNGGGDGDADGARTGMTASDRTQGLRSLLRGETAGGSAAHVDRTQQSAPAAGAGEPSRAQQVPHAGRAPTESAFLAGSPAAAQRPTMLFEAPLAAAASPAARRAAELDQTIRIDQAGALAEGALRTDAAEGDRTSGSRSARSAVVDRPGDAAPAVRGVERSLSTLASLRGGRMELTLDPAELGRVQVRMAMRGGVVRVDIIAQRAQAAEQLHARLAELRQGLERQGLVVDRMSVQVAPEPGGSSTTASERDPAGKEHAATPQHAREESEERSRGRRDESGRETDGQPPVRSDGWVDALRRFMQGDGS